MQTETNAALRRERMIEWCRMIEQSAFEWSLPSVIEVLDGFVAIFEINPEDWLMFQLLANFVSRLLKSPLKTKKDSSNKAIQHKLVHIIRLIATSQPEDAVNWPRVYLVTFLCCKICKDTGTDLQECLIINPSARSLRSLLFVTQIAQTHIKIEENQLSEIINALEKVTNDRRVLDNSYISLELFNSLKALRRMYLLEHKTDIYETRHNFAILSLLSQMNNSIWSLQALLLKAHPRNPKDETMPLVIVQTVTEYVQMNLFLSCLEFALEYSGVFQTPPSSINAIYLSKFRASSSNSPPPEAISDIEQIVGEIDTRLPAFKKMILGILNVQEFLVKQPETQSGVFEFHFLKLVSAKSNTVFCHLGMTSYEFLVEMAGKYLRSLRRTACLDYFQIFFTIFLASSKVMKSYPKILQYISEVSLPMVCKLSSNALKEFTEKEQVNIIENFLATYLKEVCKQDVMVAICRAIDSFNSSTHPKITSRLIALGEELLKADFPQFRDNEESSQENYHKMKNMILRFELWMLLKRKNLDFSFERGKDLLKFIKQTLHAVKMNPIDKVSLELSLKMMKIGFCVSNDNLNVYEFSKKIHNLLTSVVAVLQTCANKLDWNLTNHNWMFLQYDMAHRNSDIFLDNRTPNFSLVTESNVDAILSIITNINRLIYVNKLYKARADLRGACGFVFYLLKGFGSNALHMTYFLLHYFSFVKSPLTDKEKDKLAKIIYVGRSKKESSSNPFHLQLQVEILRYEIAEQFNFTKGCLNRLAK